MKLFASRCRLSCKSSLGRKSSFRIFLLAGLIVALASFITPLINDVQAQTSQTMIKFRSSALLGIRSGSLVTVPIDIANLTDPDGLGTFGFQIRYDPNFVSINDANGDDAADAGIVTGGIFLQSGGRQALCGEGYIDKYLSEPTIRYLNIACSSYKNDGSPGPQGSGNLVFVKFKPGNNLGSTTLQIVRSEIVDNTFNSNLIPHTVGTAIFDIAKCANVIQDAVVNMFDILAVGGAFGTRGESIYDLDGDGSVTIFDVLAAGRQFNQKCTI